MTHPVSPEVAKTISVVCICFPDAQTMWVPAVSGDSYIRKCVQAWKDRNKDRLEEFDAAGCQAGFVEMRILEKDYRAVPAANAIEWPK